MIKVMIYEDNSSLREGLTLLVNGTDGFEVVAAYRNCNSVSDEVAAWNPDVILMDIDMPGTNGLEGLRKIRISNNTVKVLMLTVFDDNKNIFEAIKNGANGYLLKKTPPAKLLEYIQDVASGGAPMSSSIATQVLKMFSEIKTESGEDYNLSVREKEVLQLLVNGYSYKMIAAEMNISIDTVRSNIKRIYEKLRVNSKSEAVAKAFKNRLF